VLYGDTDIRIHEALKNFSVDYHLAFNVRPAKARPARKRLPVSLGIMGEVFSGKPENFNRTNITLLAANPVAP